MTDISKKYRYAIAGICFASAVQPINFSVVSIALPVIQKDLSASLSELQWMLNLFGIFISVFLVTMGRLADTFGRKKVFLFGMLAAALSSLLSGLATSPIWVIIGQGLMGLAGAILLPVSQALLSHSFPDEERGKAIGIWATMMGTALSVGPILGGVLISLWGWRSIFLMNFIPLAIGLPLIIKYAKESKSVTHRDKLDLPGLIVLGIGIGCFVLGIIEGPNWGWDSPQSIVLFCLFVLSVISLIFIERKVSSPIINPDFFIKPTFLLASLGNFCMMFCAWPIFFLFPLYLQNVRGDTPLHAGLIMLIATASIVLFSSLIGKLYTKIGPRIPMTLGFIAYFLCITFLFLLNPTSSLLFPSIASLFFGIALALLIGPSTTAAISSIPKDLAAIASAGFTTIQEIGGTVGLTIVGTIFRMGEPKFMVGFQHGLWVLAGILVIGIISSLLLKGSKKTAQ